MITRILLPQRSRNLLRRSHLLRTLHEAISHRLILISAGAGYGKTTLAVDFAHDLTIPVCWYSLAPSDQNLRVFATHLLASLTRQFPAFGQHSSHTLNSLGRMDQSAVYPLATAMINEMYEVIPDFFLVVLDDYHHVEESRPVTDLINQLLEHAPENCHFLITSRTVPGSLPLLRLTARQQMTGLGPGDLRFTAEEVRALAKNAYQLDLTKEQAAALARDTEGWVTGVLLSASTMWGRILGGAPRSPAQPTRVYEYLASEVFQQQLPAVREFLLGSSVLDEINPQFCDRLLQRTDSALMLKTLEDQNLFLVRLGEQGEWYRYHQLFQAFLQATLLRTDRARALGLHRRAGGLWEEQGQFHQAIDHYLRGEAYDEAIRLLENELIDLFVRGEWHTVSAWIEALPPEMCEERPLLLVAQATVALETGEPDRAYMLLEKGRVHCARQENHQGEALALIQMAGADLLKGRYPEAIEKCQAALHSLEGVVGSEKVVVRAYRTLGTCYRRIGDLPAALNHLERALRMYERLGFPGWVAFLHQDLSVAYAEYGDLHQAIFHLRQALRYWREVGNPTYLARVTNDLGFIHYLNGEFDEAQEALEEALLRAREAEAPQAEAYVLASLGDLYRDMGQLSLAAERFQEGYRVAEQAQEGFLMVYCLNGQAETARLQGAHSRAERLVQRALALAQSHHSSHEIAMCRATLGINDYQWGNLGGGERELLAAARQFEKGGARRELARVRLHLAQVAFLSGRPKQALHRLTQAMEIASQLGYDHFLVLEAREMQPMVQKVASLDEESGVCGHLLERIQELTPSLTSGEREAAPPRPKDEEPYTLRVYALGPTQVFLHSEPVLLSRWASVRTRELFYFLLAHPEGVRRDQVGELFWPDLPASKMNSVFHTVLYRLRRALFSDCVVYDDGRYRFNEAVSWWYDARVFERLLDRAKEAEDPDEQIELYQEALALYRGDYLEEFYSDWCLQERERLRERFMTSAMALADLYYERKSPELSIGVCQSVLARDRYQERAYHRLIRCYAAMGDRAAAIKAYRQCVELLREDLGLDPMPETEELYRQILG
ncbi:MAG: tetratricopeptide repeat protein [Anaerolineae bacterium]